MSWRSDAVRLDTTVTWTLHPEDNGTRLLLRQDGSTPTRVKGERATSWETDGTARLLRDLATFFRNLRTQTHEDE
jgi:hypothetical protein